MAGPVGEKAEAVSKEHAFLATYRARTTAAAWEAFERLLKELRGSGWEARFPGKNRMAFTLGERKLKVTIGEVALQCFVNRPVAVADVKYRSKPTDERGYAWTCGLTGHEDIEYLLLLIGEGG
jgi:hypothetical protein